eukprot:TRINITY_DN4717_c0_g2_i1.p1 TRINITY_DN4717_c0_g2~~TRINITY_DN4717_c0_g2_i1.p1  ORF type:complete len:1067 (+),score=193.16 TRINITY_DN4717_c0_g2_i1:51-3203(+)
MSDDEKTPSIKGEADRKGSKGGAKKKGGGKKDKLEEDNEAKFFKTASIEAVLEHLQTTEKGLTNEDVELRLKQYGENKLPEHNVNPVIKFLLFFWNPLSWTMEIAATLSIILGDYVDFLLISGLLLLNACIGFYEEHSSANAMEALKNQLAPTALCLRDGEYTETPAFQLVPGDIVRLGLGDVIPADLKLLANGDGMKIDQSSLTGESLPVSKYPGDELFAGSSVKQGEMNAVVYATGVHTFFGKAANLVSTTESHGHFQTVLKQIGLFCIIFIAICVALELLIQFPARQKPCTGLSWEPGKRCPTMDNILVLIVGGIPIAMPTVLSVTMAMGAAKLAEKQAIVARLTAIEELAGMDVLCSDKTGTLTLNKLTLSEPIVVDQHHDVTPETVKLHAALAAQRVNADAIDFAVTESLGENKHVIEDEYELIKLVPFDPVSKRSTATLKRKSDGKVFKTCKGAPQVLLKSVVNRDEIGELVDAKIEEFASRGFRTLGVGYCDEPNLEEKKKGEEGGDHDGEEWYYEGIIPLYDPPRHDTKEVIEKVKHYGIMVKMITGDQTAIARETCRQLGLASNILTPDKLEQAEREGNTRMVETTDGFAQVFPEHKYNIVAGLQRLNHIVGMTGDGVNDAPALKKADIGIAVADATDAARAASDIVLVSPGLGVIVDAIFGSRKIFQRMRNYVLYSVSATVRVCVTFTILTIAFDFYFPTIVIAIMAILNDGTILTISKDRVSPSPEPDHWNLPKIFIFAMVLGTYMVAETIVLFCIVRETAVCTSWLTMPELTDAQIRGLIYMNVSISGQATIFITRTHGWWFQSRPSVLLMMAFVIAQVFSTLIGLYGFNGYPNDGEADFDGCGWSYTLFTWCWTLVWFMFKDPLKFFTYWMTDFFYKAQPVKRTRKAFGHPVYGRHGKRSFSPFSAWPHMAMEPPAPEDVAEVAAGMRRASMDLVEAPWQTDDAPAAGGGKSHHKKGKGREAGQLVKGDRMGTDSDEEGSEMFKLHRHHHPHQHTHHHHNDSDSESYSTDQSSYDTFSEGSDEDIKETKKSKGKKHH